MRIGRLRLRNGFSSHSAGICLTYLAAAGRTMLSLPISSAGLRRSCSFTFRSRNLMTSPSVCAKTNWPPRATMGTLRAPSLRNSSIPAGLPCTLIDSYSTPLLVRNSLVLRQLVHPGCQKTLTLSATSMIVPPNGTAGLACFPLCEQVGSITLRNRQIQLRTFCYSAVGWEWGSSERRAHEQAMDSRLGDNGDRRLRLRPGFSESHRKDRRS